MKTLIQSLRMVILLTLLTGVVYPLAVTLVAKVAFPEQAEGSLIRENGKIVGSRLLATKVESDRYFWPRPSAADFAMVASGASNKGPTSADLAKAIAARRATLGANAPVDLVTTSASGLDPDLSPEAALYQVERVAKARGIEPARVKDLVERFQEPPQFGILGEPRVNVLTLNRALDAAN